MKKPLEILQAEQIVASILREDKGDPQYVLAKARQYADNFRFSIAQRVTTTIWLLTIWEMWEDVTVEDLNRYYDEYLKYHKSFDEGNENIFKQMLEINKMLDGKLITGKIYNAVLQKGEEDETADRDSV